ncbi:MAG: response regulator transcription factor [Anaerolineales bacterium]
MKTKILWIEGSKKATPPFVANLRERGYQVETVSTGKAALVRVPRMDPDLAVVNAASLRTTGNRICSSLRATLNGNPILLIAGESQDATKTESANQVLVLPFTIRKLVNRIRGLVPKEGDKILRAGPISLYMKRQVVRCAGGGPRRLTPRLTTLLEMLMKRRGEVIDRDELFRKVWQTDYVGDTRTLDVHISWLRKKIEKDPRNPQLLKTIRGIGYRLDA